MLLLKTLNFRCVQLCDSLVDGGVTPSLGKIGISRATFEIYHSKIVFCMCMYVLQKLFVRQSRFRYTS